VQLFIGSGQSHASLSSLSPHQLREEVALVLQNEVRFRLLIRITFLRVFLFKDT